MRLYGRDARAATMGLAGLSLPPPNNGMHPTADTTAVIYLNLVGRRVMPGDMPLRIKTEAELKGAEQRNSIAAVEGYNQSAAYQLIGPGRELAVLLSLSGG